MSSRRLYSSNQEPSLREALYRGRVVPKVSIVSRTLNDDAYGGGGRWQKEQCDGRWQMADGSSSSRGRLKQTADGRRQTADGRRQMADGGDGSRWQMAVAGGRWQMAGGRR
jgi:hypothetical protein